MSLGSRTEEALRQHLLNPQGTVLQNSTGEQEKRRKKLHNYLGRTIREMKRNNIVTPSFAICEQVYLSKYDPSKKLYSIHKPQVECIAKGKAQPYEFGVKVSITEVARSGFVLEATAIHGNPYDGHTLKNCR